MGVESVFAVPIWQLVGGALARIVTKLLRVPVVGVGGRRPDSGRGVLSLRGSSDKSEQNFHVTKE